MSESAHAAAQPPTSRRGYHHGNLKDALIEAARSLMTERRGAGFTLAEAAKLAGVTAAAPYRHFNDRNALLCELARRGFDAFNARLQDAWDAGRPDPIAALRRMGRAYLDFARQESGLYAAMFGDARILCGGPPIDSGAAALKALREAASAVLTHLGAERLDARRLGAEIWAISHGIASLVNSGHILEGAESVDPMKLLEESVGALLEKAARSRPHEGQVDWRASLP